MGRLDGKVALISGTGPNNGGTTAVMMAKEGAKVVCNDIVAATAEETAAVVRSKGGDAIHTVGDISDGEAIKAVVKAGVEAFGYIDTLVNLPAAHSRGGVLDFDLEEWNNELAVGLTGSALLMKEVATRLVAQGRRGSLINIASVTALQGQPGWMAYSTAKAGLANLTRSAAAELAHLGIRVNVICPVGMEHNLWRYQPWRNPQPRERFSLMTQDTLDAIPIGRLMRSTDLGHLAVFLASDESEAITGGTFPLDGGALSCLYQWMPGRYTKLTLDEYVKTKALYQRYGDTVMGPGVDTDQVPPPGA